MNTQTYNTGNILTDWLKSMILYAVADPGFAKEGGGGWTMASARSASLNGGLGQSPQRGPGAEPLKLKAFCTFYTKKWPKVKDLSENLPPCLSRAAMTSPMFWSMGGGRPDHP